MKNQPSGSASAECFPCRSSVPAIFDSAGPEFSCPCETFRTLDQGVSPTLYAEESFEALSGRSGHFRPLYLQHRTWVARGVDARSVVGAGTRIQGGVK